MLFVHSMIHGCFLAADSVPVPVAASNLRLPTDLFLTPHSASAATAVAPAVAEDCCSSATLSDEGERSSKLYEVLNFGRHEVDSSYSFILEKT
jgi:hypothetical protein